MESEMTAREEAIQNILDRCADIREQAEELIEKQEQQLAQLYREEAE